MSTLQELQDKMGAGSFGEAAELLSNVYDLVGGMLPSNYLGARDVLESLGRALDIIGDRATEEAEKRPISTEESPAERYERWKWAQEPNLLTLGE